MQRWVIINSGWTFHVAGQPEQTTPTYYVGKIDTDTDEVKVIRRILSAEELKHEREQLGEANALPAKGPTLAQAQAARSNVAPQRRAPAELSFDHVKKP